jgi:hypothetical protein
MGRPPIGKTAMTDAERMRRYRLKHGTAKPVTKLADPDHAMLVKELAAAKVTIQAQAAEIARLKAKLADGIGARFAQRPSKAKAKPTDQPPPIPGSELDKLQQQNKGLRTRVRNLTVELHHVHEHSSSKIARDGGMDFATKGAIAKCLQPQSRDNVTEADKDRACQLFNGFISDHRQSKGRRPA